MQPGHPTALIAGAGIGAIASGIALRRAGWNVQLFERARSPQELGFDLMLASNAMAALRELGVADEVARRSITVGSVSFRIGTTRPARRIDLAAVPVRLRPLIASRQALHGVLLDGLGLDSIMFGAEVAGFETTARGVILRLADGRSFEGDILVGADGVGSVVRRALHPNVRPRATGLAGARGVAYGLPDLLEADFAMTSVPGSDSGIIRGVNGSVYWFVSSRVPSSPGAGCDVEAFGEPLRSIVRSTKDEDMRSEPFLDSDPLDTWGRDRVTLLGDAAHPMLPHAGQGAAQALEDAVALGLALRGNRDVAAALRRYEYVRAPRTAHVVRLARRMAAIRMSRSRVLAWSQRVMVRVVPNRALGLARLIRTSDPHRALRDAIATLPPGSGWGG